MTNSFWSTIVAVAVFVPLGAGCGGHGGRVEVRGEVKANGAPIQSGSISFVPKGGAGVSAGATITSGQYEIPAAHGPLPGKYRVEIKAARKTGEKIVDDMRPPPDNLVDKIEQFLPAHYNTSSTLTAEIVAGSQNSINFDLELKPSP